MPEKENSVIAISDDDIISIDADGIDYKIAGGQTQHIEFKRCIENCRSSHKPDPNWKKPEIRGQKLIIFFPDGQEASTDLSGFSEKDFQEYKEKIERNPDISTCVGERDATAKPMFFKFFENRIVRVEFKYRWFRKKAYQRFQKLQDRLSLLNLSTFDLT